MVHFAKHSRSKWKKARINFLNTGLSLKNNRRTRANNFFLYVFARETKSNIRISKELDLTKLLVFLDCSTYNNIPFCIPNATLLFMHVIFFNLEMWKENDKWWWTRINESVQLKRQLSDDAFLVCLSTKNNILFVIRRKSKYHPHDLLCILICNLYEL